MKNVKLLTFIIIFSLISSTLFAQTRSRLSKVGFIDTASIYNDINKNESLVDIIVSKFRENEERFNEIVDTIKTTKSEMTKIERELKKFPAGTNVELEERYKTLEANMAVLEKQYNELSPIVNAQKTKRQQAINLEIRRHMAPAIATLTRRQGYTAILEKRENGVLYVDRDFDITSQVLPLVIESIKKNEIK